MCKLQIPKEACKTVPPPGCFAERACIRLITKELSFLARTKRPQEVDASRVKGGALGGVGAVGSR